MVEKSEKDPNEKRSMDEAESAPDAYWACCFAGDPRNEDELYESAAEDCCCCCC